MGRCFAILFALLMLCPAVPVQADHLRIVILRQAPYGYMLDGKPTGLAYEIGSAIAEEADLTYENRLVSLQRGVEEISQGRADMIIMFPSPAIEKVASNQGPFLPMETVILGRAGSDFNSFEDLSGKSVATLRGAKYDARLTVENNITPLPTKSYLRGLKQVLDKSVDAIIGPKFGLDYIIKINALSREQFGSPLVLQVVHAGVFVSHGAHAGVSRKIREAMGRLRKKGLVEALLAKYSL